MSIPSGEIIPCHRLSFRKSLLIYLKTSANPRLSLKLMQISRFFCYKEFPYTVIENIIYEFQQWKYLQPGFSPENPTKPLWITHVIVYHHVENRISRLLSKTAVCDVKKLNIRRQRLKMDDFKFLVSSKVVEEIVFWYTVVLYDDGSVVPIDEIVKFLPNLKVLEWIFSDASSEITPTSTSKLIEHLNPVILTRFVFIDVAETFDFNLFTEFMDKNPSIYFYLEFNEEISNEYANILQSYLDKLLKSSEYFNRKIWVRFP